MPLASVHFDKPCVLSASHFQATTATINTNHFPPPQARGPGLIPSRTPASSLPPGAWKRGQAQTNRNSNIYGSSPWALHLHSVTLDLTAPGLAGEGLCLRACCCRNLPTSTAKECPNWDDLLTINAEILFLVFGFHFKILGAFPSRTLGYSIKETWYILLICLDIVSWMPPLAESDKQLESLIYTVLSASFVVRIGLESLTFPLSYCRQQEYPLCLQKLKKFFLFRLHKNVRAEY